MYGGKRTAEHNNNNIPFDAKSSAGGDGGSGQKRRFTLRRMLADGDGGDGRRDARADGDKSELAGVSDLGGEAAERVNRW